MEKFITKDMVIRGYNQHLINLILSPNGDGIACQIGDNWFYFGGSTAEEYDNVAEYKEIMLTSDIIKEIYDVLCELKTEFADEYLYYYYYLMENLKADKPEKKFVRVDIVDNDADYGCDKVMDTYILMNPNTEKLTELQELLNNRFESGKFEQYSDIDDYIMENFEVLQMADFIEIEW